MANEFRIKNALLVEGSTNSQPIVAIRDSSLEITTDASSLLVTAKAIYDFHDSHYLWDLSTNSSTVYLKDPCDNVQLSYIEMKQDGGALLMVDMPISSPTGEQSYAMKLDGSNALKIYGATSGSSISETAVVVQTTYFALGDPTVDGCWRFRVDASGLEIEYRTGGAWVNKGQFNSW